MSKIVLPPVTGNNNTSRINDNFQLIANALDENVLYRDNIPGEPNEMESPLDMNGQRIYNLPRPYLGHEPARLQDIREIGTLPFSYFGPLDAPPLTRPDGTPLQEGDSYYNTVTQLLYYWNGSSWFVPNIDGQMLQGADGATLVGYTSYFNGAVTRPVAEKLYEQVSVKDAGAVGSGIVNDQIACQKALDSGASVVIFPPGFYLLSTGLTIRSNTTVIGYGAVLLQPNADISATGSAGTEYCGFRVDVGSTDINILGFDIRGPYYNGTVTPAYRSIGIHIQGRYDQYFYNNPLYPASPAVVPTGTNFRICLRDNKINGFGQSAVLADQVTYFTAVNNVLVNNCRDGIRMYGALSAIVANNHVDTLGPGMPLEGIPPNNNVYGIEFTRIYHSTNGDGSTTDYRPSRNCIAEGNSVRNCPSWKGMGTHGGLDITFANNVIERCHIGIGIDKGGSNLADGFAPPRRIKIIGNNIRCVTEPTFDTRAAITLFAEDETANNIGEDVTVADNTFVGPWGQDNRDGCVVVSNYRTVNFNGNIYNGIKRAAINVQLYGVNINIRGEIITNVVTSGLGVTTGINLQSGNIRASIDDVYFSQGAALNPLTAISVATSNPGFGVTVGQNCTFFNNVIQVNGGGVPLAPDSLLQKRVLAHADINNTGGSAVFTLNRGFASVTRTGVGIVQFTLPSPMATIQTAHAFCTVKGNNPYVFSVNNISTTVIEVRTYSILSSALADVGFKIQVVGY